MRICGIIYLITTNTDIIWIMYFVEFHIYFVDFVEGYSDEYSRSIQTYQISKLLFFKYFCNAFSSTDLEIYTKRFLSRL